MATSETTSWLSDTEGALHRAIHATDTRAQITNLEDTKATLDELLAEFRRIAAADAVARSTGWGGRAPNPDLFDDLRNANETLDPRPSDTLDSRPSALRGRSARRVDRALAAARRSADGQRD